MTTPKNGIIIGVLDIDGAFYTEQQVDDPNKGDMVYFGDPEWVALAPGTAGHFLQTQGAGAAPAWAPATASFDDIVLDLEGRIVYVGDGEFVLRE